MEGSRDERRPVSEDLPASAKLIFAIPLPRVNGVYGPDGLDSATDDLLLALSRLTGRANPNCVVEVDVSSRDASEHLLRLEVSGLTPGTAALFERQLVELGLAERSR